MKGTIYYFRPYNEDNMTSALKRGRIACETIRIYLDKGTCNESVKAIQAQLANLPFKIKTISATSLLQKEWEAKTVALIMAGGQCSEWDKSLGTDGIRRIRQFVQNGGKYLGICAGAYFAARASLFQLQDLPPIIKERPLAFYPGCASGPILTTSNHLSPKAALAVRIKLLTKKGFCYYQGGCSCDIAEDKPGIKILARYKRPYTGSAILSCDVNGGKAILCGPHPEFAWNSTLATEATEPAFRHLVDALSPEEGFRKDIWDVMLRELLA